MDSTNRQYYGQYQQRRDYRHRTQSPRDRWRSRSPSRPHVDGFQGHHERERRQPRRRSWEPRRDDRQNRNPSTGIGYPTQAIASSMCLGESSSEGNITVSLTLSSDQNLSDLMVPRMAALLSLRSHHLHMIRQGQDFITPT